MRVPTVHLTLASGLLGLFLISDPLAAQTAACEGCTSSSSCDRSTSRGLCQWGCSQPSGVCTCGDAPCSILKPVTMGAEAVAEALLASAAGHTSVRTMLVTGCDGERQVLAVVSTPFGMGVVQLPRPASWAPVAAAGPGGGEDGDRAEPGRAAKGGG